MIEELNGDFLQWLRGFYFVATTGSVRGAANMMNRNPSTISYQLKSLEEELGIMLFDRHKKNLLITEEGKKLLAWTISTFETLKDMRSSVCNKKGEYQGNIRIAATLPILALSVGAIGKFVKKHPKIYLRIERMLSHEVRLAVEEAVVDFGILPVINIPENGNFEIILQARSMLIVHKSNPWKVPLYPSIEVLRSLPYISFIEKGGMDELGTYMRLNGIGDFVKRNSVVQINNYHLILRFVWQKLGVALMDELCFKASQFGAEWDQLTAISLEHLLPDRKYGLLTRKNRRYGLQAKAFISHLTEFFESFPADGSESAWEMARQKNKNIK